MSDGLLGVVVSHGPLGAAFLEAVRQITGEANGLVAVSNEGCDREALLARLEAAIGTHPVGTGGVPVVEAGAIGVDENDVAGFRRAGRFTVVGRRASAVGKYSSAVSLRSNAVGRRPSGVGGRFRPRS